jgi:hypothetical protein
VQQREDCRDNVYNVYNNQRSEQSYSSIAAWCGDTGLITVGCGSTADKRKRVDCSMECTSKLIYIGDMNVHVSV